MGYEGVNCTNSSLTGHSRNRQQLIKLLNTLKGYLRQMYFRSVCHCRIFLAYPENPVVEGSQSQEMCVRQRLGVAMVLGGGDIVNDSSGIKMTRTLPSWWGWSATIV